MPAFAHRSFVLLCIIAVAALFPQSTAHTYILKPKGDRTPDWTATCRVGGPRHAPNNNCPGPCIDTSKKSWRDASGRPTVYRRGQTVPLVWARNGHTGGFVRFSLVPRSSRMSKGAHNRMAFRYACFESGVHKCREDRCGTDRNGNAYRTMAQIPTTHPDGEYVLGFAWYGGTTANRYGFGDYYSCANVIIRGGPMTSKYTPKFIPGEGTGGKKTCSSATKRLGECAREPCRKHYERDVIPLEFSNGRRPKPILASWFR